MARPSDETGPRRRSARLSAVTAGGDVKVTDVNSKPVQNRSARAGTKRKAPEPTNGSTRKAPSTPTKRQKAGDPRTKPESKMSPPPAAIPYSTPKPRSKALGRVADEANLTHAPLLSPETSRIIMPKALKPFTPSSQEPATSSTLAATSATILDTALAHLIDVDERMRPLIEAHTCKVFAPEGLAEKVDPFESLVSGIISQQVSGAAAKSIKAKFVALFEPSAAEKEKGGRSFPHPSQVAACKLERLRTAGLSQRKAEYVQGLAEKFVSGELSAQMLADAPYDEVVEKLVAVRGLGRWSVEMFACFGLKRLDVFSTGDLGVQRGMAAFVGRDVAKLKSKGGKWKYMSEKEMLEISEKFAPYRSLFMWYMWRVEETDVSTME